MSTNSTPALEGIEHRSVDVGGGVTIHVVDARQPPKLGEHTDDMLREASEGEAEIEHPRAGGALA